MGGEAGREDGFTSVNTGISVALTREEESLHTVKDGVNRDVDDADERRVWRKRCRARVGFRPGRDIGDIGSIHRKTLLRLTEEG